MADIPRALLTRGERRAIRGDDDMDSNTRSSHLSRVRQKIPKLEEDVALLREHRPEDAAAIEDAICRDSVEYRLNDMDSRIGEIEHRLRQLERDLSEGDLSEDDPTQGTNVEGDPIPNDEGE